MAEKLACRVYADDVVSRPEKSTSAAEAKVVIGARFLKVARYGS